MWCDDFGSHYLPSINANCPVSTIQILNPPSKISKRIFAFFSHDTSSRHNRLPQFIWGLNKNEVVILSLDPTQPHFLRLRLLQPVIPLQAQIQLMLHLLVAGHQLAGLPQPKFRLGSAAMDAMQQFLLGKRPESKRLGAELVVRSSSGTAPATPRLKQLKAQTKETTL